MSHPLISLEQWRAFIAVVDAGGYAQAAEELHKSQSAITYAVKKLEATLEVALFRLAGRRAVLTPVGQLLVQRARQLLDEAGRIEHAARALSAGWEAQLTVAVEVLFPTWLLLECLAVFGAESPHTHIELIESVLGGTQEALLERGATIALTPHIPVGFSGEPLLDLRFLLVANPTHPLHALGRDVEPRDLRRHRHLVVRESGRRRDTQLSLHSEQRWTVSNMPTSIGAACRGYGYAWLPEGKIRRELAEGTLKPLRLRGGSERRSTMYLIIADADGAGPGTRRLAAIIRERSRATT